MRIALLQGGDAPLTIAEASPMQGAEQAILAVGRAEEEGFGIDPALLGQALGILSTILFTLQYLPQTYLNYQRKSMKGFSAPGIILKHVGATFLVVNAWVLGEAFPVIGYGLCNTIQHSLFMWQFSTYEANQSFLLWVFFPLVPVTIYHLFPASLVFTMSIKPICQVLSHFPQLQECYRCKTTSGVSMLTQHLNIAGGLAGLYMCYVIPPKSSMTVMLYVNSVFQALSLYAMYFYYDYKRPKPVLSPKGLIHDV